MLLQGILELRIMRRFDHLRQSVGDLVFRVVKVAQLLHEQLLEVFQFHGEKSHSTS